jgi:hypothetical protein
MTFVARESPEKATSFSHSLDANMDVALDADAKVSYKPFHAVEFEGSALEA